MILAMLAGEGREFGGYIQLTAPSSAKRSPGGRSGSRFSHVWRRVCQGAMQSAPRLGEGLCMVGDRSEEIELAERARREAQSRASIAYAGAGCSHHAFSLGR